jgi:hypothetical protein
VAFLNFSASSLETLNFIMAACLGSAVLLKLFSLFYEGVFLRSSIYASLSLED